MTTKELLLQEIELMSEKQLSEMLILAKNIRQKSSDIGHNTKQELSIITETITSSEITQMAQNSSVFEFLKDETDLYTLEDGEAI